MRKCQTLAALCALGWAVASSSAAAAPGQLDPSFGQGGHVTVPLAGGVNIVNRTMVQPDNKILVLAQTFQGSPLLVRLLATGAVDTGFGGHGAVGVAFSGMFTATSDMAIQSDGKIIVVGFVFPNNLHEPPRHAFVARFNPNGTLDTGFGAKGASFFAPSGTDAATAVLLQNDGKILVGDTSQSSNGGQAVLRLNTDGTLDQTFGVFGVATVVDGGFEVLAMALQRDGKIIVASFRGFPFQISQTPVAARLLPNGTLDTTTTPGSVLASTPAGTIAVQPNSQYVSNGFVGNQGQFDVVWRYSLNNVRDNSFASSPIDSGRLFRAASLLVAPDGKVIAAGFGMTGSGGSTAFELARLGANGVIDSTFGAGGTVQTSFAGRSRAGVGGLALQADGRIVAAGLADGPTGSNPVLAVARYLGK